MHMLSRLMFQCQDAYHYNYGQIIPFNGWNKKIKEWRMLCNRCLVQDCPPWSVLLCAHKLACVLVLDAAAHAISRGTRFSAAALMQVMSQQSRVSGLFDMHATVSHFNSQCFYWVQPTSWKPAFMSDCVHAAYLGLMKALQDDSYQ